MPDHQPDLAALARTDRLIDALAAREPAGSADPAEDALAALLADWRDELRWPPASALVSDRQAAAALNSGLAKRPRSHRGLALVGSAAAGVLALGGFGALVGGAQPGDALYGVHTVLFGEPPSVHDDQIELAAKTELAKVAQMITQGQWGQAQERLASVNNSVQTVNDTDRKQGLIDQVNQLNAKVASRDPNATAPAPTTPSATLSATSPELMTSTSSSPPSSADVTTSTVSDSATSTSTTASGSSSSPAPTPASSSSEAASSTTVTESTTPAG